MGANVCDDVFGWAERDPGRVMFAAQAGGRWLRTGDLGRINDDGYVYVTGRKKDMLITAGGQHVAPSVLEDTVRERWLIAECVVTGERRPYVAALITLDQDAFARWKQRQGKPAGATIGDLADDPDLRAVIQQAVDRANAAVSRPEAIKRFRILPGQFQTGAELTPTGKIRRDYVLAKYASDIDALYAQPDPAVPQPRVRLFSRRVAGAGSPHAAPPITGADAPRLLAGPASRPRLPGSSRGSFKRRPGRAFTG